MSVSVWHLTLPVPDCLLIVVSTSSTEILHLSGIKFPVKYPDLSTWLILPHFLITSDICLPLILCNYLGVKLICSFLFEAFSERLQKTFRLIQDIKNRHVYPLCNLLVSSTCFVRLYERVCFYWFITTTLIGDLLRQSKLSTN